jgi:anti-sigma factor ChrR (cupin superfamily)
MSTPGPLLRPSDRLWDRLAKRVCDATDSPALPAPPVGSEPAWEAAGPGLSYSVLSLDPVNRRVSLFVRLEPGAAYPQHVHAGTEELYFLDGVLWIDDRKLVPGDYNRATAGTEDRRVWSESGCTCVLLTSLEDRLTG